MGGTRAHNDNILGPLVLVAAIAPLAACTFDTSNQASVGDGDVVAPPDADKNRPDAIDPANCPDDIHIEVRVNGRSEPLGPGQPYTHTLVGDTVQLSASGTCTRSGTINYTWQIAPTNKGADATALPNHSSETISVYSKLPFEYIVYLTVNDGTSAQTRDVFAFTAHGFEELGFVPGADVRDLSAGADYLWIGGNEGAFRADLSSPDTGTYPLVDDLYGGAGVSNKIRAVHESAAGDYVWFGADIDEGLAYRLELAADEVTTIDTLTDAKTRDISDAPTGVRYATDRGVALAADSESFIEERSDPSDALSFGGTGSWAGKDKLYRLPSGPDLDVFGGNNKIISLADDDTLVWVGGDGKGVATVLDGVAQDLYTATNSNLSNNKPRAMAADGQGDIWVATQQGVNRFKRDRQVWVPMVDSSGLGNQVDLRAIAVDEKSGRRAIYAGGRDGLAVMRTP